MQDVLYFAMPNTRMIAAKRRPARLRSTTTSSSTSTRSTAASLRSITSEIAFVFHNLTEPQIRIATGDAPAGYALQDKVSHAWINFARTGNPSQPGLEWKPFTAADPQTMVFDIVSECRNLGYDKLAPLLGNQAPFPTAPPAPPPASRAS